MRNDYIKTNETTSAILPEKNININDDKNSTSLTSSSVGLNEKALEKITFWVTAIIFKITPSFLLTVRNVMILDIFLCYRMIVISQ